MVSETTWKRLARLAIGALVCVAVSGCDSVDPTASSHFTNVLVRNNTASAVEFVQCDTTCGTLHDRQTIASGATTIVNVSNEGIKVGYVVARPRGPKLGCVYMKCGEVKPSRRFSSLR